MHVSHTASVRAPVRKLWEMLGSPGPRLDRRPGRPGRSGSQVPRAGPAAGEQTRVARAHTASSWPQPASQDQRRAGTAGTEARVRPGCQPWLPCAPTAGTNRTWLVKFIKMKQVHLLGLTSHAQWVPGLDSTEQSISVILASSLGQACWRPGGPHWAGVGLGGHLAKSDCHSSRLTGTWRMEIRDAGRHRTEHRVAPPQTMIQPQASVGPRWRLCPRPSHT